jgi:hypothetical protein
MSVACFLGIELLFLAAAHVFGGPPWTLLGMLAFVAQVVVDFRVRPLVVLVPSLVWLAGFHTTGNRELFFPYAMYLATYVALLLADRTAWLGCLGGGFMVAAFLVIRVLQAATAAVLVVELVVAAAILAIALAAHIWGLKSRGATAAIIAFASLAAYASLAL